MPRLKKPPGWPRYMDAKKLANGTTAYFWHVPSIYISQGCTLKSEPLGTDYALATHRCNELLNPSLDAWRAGDEVLLAPAKGTLDWLIGEFYQNKKFLDLSSGSQKDYRRNLDLLSELTPRNLPGYKRVGDIPLSLINPGVADRVYERLSEKSDGTQRLTTANYAMRAMRRAWNVVYRAHSTIVSEQNPFSRMDLKSSTRTTKPATRGQLNLFIESADRLDYQPIGTAALITFEWLLREADIISTFAWSDYRSPNRPDAVRLRHGKTREAIWLPLYNDQGSLYPELTDRLDDTDKIGPLIVMRNKKDRRRNEYLPYKVDWFRHCVAAIRDHAGLPKEITFASFRHGGLTELGDAGLTEQRMMSLSAHKTRDMLTVYSKRNETQRKHAAEIRLNYRLTVDAKGTNQDRFSE